MTPTTNPSDMWEAIAFLVDAIGVDQAIWAVFLLAIIYVGVKLILGGAGLLITKWNEKDKKELEKKKDLQWEEQQKSC
jgi:hypothetical protein